MTTTCCLKKIFIILLYINHISASLLELTRINFPIVSGPVPSFVLSHPKISISNPDDKLAFENAFKKARENAITKTIKEAHRIITEPYKLDDNYEMLCKLSDAKKLGDYNDPRKLDTKDLKKISV